VRCAGRPRTLTLIFSSETLRALNSLTQMPRGATKLGPIYLITPTDAYARRGPGVAQAWRYDGGLWRANEPWLRGQGPLPDSRSHATRDYSSLDEALHRSALMTTDDWPARFVKTLAQAFRRDAHVAANWDWTVVARAVGVAGAAMMTVADPIRHFCRARHQRRRAPLASRG